MTHTLIVSDQLYSKLKQTVRQRGSGTIEHLLELWQAEEEQRALRYSWVEQVHSLRERLQKKYGTMPDSTLLLQVDRER